MTEHAPNTENGHAPLIRTVGLCKLYTTEEVETTALDNVNLEIAEGEFAAIMGPSGCGKSTLLNLLGLLDNPSEGEYYLLDEEVATYSGASAGESAQGDDRLCLSVVQPDQRIDGTRECRVASALHGDAGYGAQAAGAVDPRRHADHPPREALSAPAFRRPAAARGRGAGLGRGAEAGAGG